ncbi:hypothetical protein RHD99_13295 [Buttiauxella selenatireducens]|uniref:Uncharacterized protein n=1 Tax=Buttiauxella selenatireducens TaxID=3073902 RepID=A0ABY9S4T8_9ENTR|nr:hypothetical protein [Buttiauxella sp. R73]WMY72463.1 hypothetical protein RHD99_13295 [Buttiauxella sp. R73]
MIWRRFRMTLIILALLTGALLLAAGVLSETSPVLGVQHLLLQARYGLLVWRLCLYTAIAILWCRAYHPAAPASRRQMKRTMVCFMLLVTLSEISNLLQTGGAA